MDFILIQELIQTIVGQPDIKNYGSVLQYEHTDGLNYVDSF
jgi:hypothetical protein